MNGCVHDSEDRKEIGPIRLNVGREWLHRFDVLTERGVPTREIVKAMADQLDSMFNRSVDVMQTFGAPRVFMAITKCPHCGRIVS